MNKKRKGFTLIELIVVIAILGILAAIAIPRLTGVRANAAKNADIATARTIAGAASTYEADTGAGPTDISKLVPKYLDSVPVSATDNTKAFFINDTSGGAALKVTLEDAAGTEYYPTHP